MVSDTLTIYNFGYMGKYKIVYDMLSRILGITDCFHIWFALFIGNILLLDYSRFPWNIIKKLQHNYDVKLN